MSFVLSISSSNSTGRGDPCLVITRASSCDIRYDFDPFMPAFRRSGGIPPLVGGCLPPGDYQAVKDFSERERALYSVFFMTSFRPGRMPHRGSIFGYLCQSRDRAVAWKTNSALETDFRSTL